MHAWSMYMLHPFNLYEIFTIVFQTYHARVFYVYITSMYVWYKLDKSNIRSNTPPAVGVWSLELVSSHVDSKVWCLWNICITLSSSCLSWNIHALCRRDDAVRRLSQLSGTVCQKRQYQTFWLDRRSYFVRETLKVAFQFIMLCGY